MTELADRLDVIGLLDAAIGPIKRRNRGHTGGQLLVGLGGRAAGGEDFRVGLARQRADTAGQALAPVPGLAGSSAAGLARRLGPGQWRAVETGLGDVAATALAALATTAPARADALRASVTIDLDTTDVEAAAGLGMLAAPVDEAGPARRTAVAGAALEIGATRLMRRRMGMVAEPYEQGRSGTLMRAGAVGTVVGAVAAALLGRRRRSAAVAAGATLMVSSALTRFGVFTAGKASAADPKYTVVPQRRRLEDRAESDGN